MLTGELWAYLTTLPGRCRDCAAYVATQRHRQDCPGSAVSASGGTGELGLAGETPDTSAVAEEDLTGVV